MVATKASLELFSHVPCAFVVGITAMTLACNAASNANADASDTDTTGESQDASDEGPSSSADTETSESSADSDGGTTGSDTGPDGCSDALAEGLSIRTLTGFQVVGIPLAEAGAEVAPSSRIADLVANREMVLRVDYDLPADWSARTLSARVRVEGADASSELFFDTQSVSASSTPGELDTSFHIELPADAVAEGASYSVEVVECDEGWSGTDSIDARFPAAGNAALGAVHSGSLKIHIIPFRVAGFTPETTPEILEGFADAVRAMYPTPEVVITVGEVYDDGPSVDMGEHLVKLGQLRDQQQAPPDVYYYGLISGAETREEFCSWCPTGTSEEAGGTHLGFAVGAAFGDELSESTLVHELGHMHGRRHSPCGNPNLLDPDYPYPDGSTMVEGYDFRSGQFIAPSTNDLMGYCQPRWVSDYTYRALTAWHLTWNP